MKLGLINKAKFCAKKETFLKDIYLKDFNFLTENKLKLLLCYLIIILAD
jgi:hypothetical protein